MLGNILLYSKMLRKYRVRNGQIQQRFLLFFWIDIKNATVEFKTFKQREILKLKYIEGFTITEIAELLKCSHQNVSKLNSSAINSMQKALEL